MALIRHHQVLITGVAGFVGSSLATNLVTHDVHVTGIDSLIRGTLDRIQPLRPCKNFSFVKGDLLNHALLQQQTRDIDVIFHEAALIDVTESIHQPALYEKHNVLGTRNVLEAARRNEVTRVIFASSCAVYGHQATLPIPEDAPLTPLSPYAETKIQGETLCHQYAAAYGLSSVILRYFNVYGPGQHPSAYSGVITRFIANARSDEALTIYGDGTQTRDFIHVEDICHANLLAATEQQAAGEIINIGSGRPTTINGLATMIRHITHKPRLPIIHAPPRPGDIPHSHAAIEKAQRILGFQPQYDLQAGLKTTLQRSPHS
jgi:UDP-glucose 4-epimerase